jgi:hypothetical protein
MSALGQKRTYAVQQPMSALLSIATAKADFPQKAMSALPPKADMCSAQADVRFVPIADMGPVSNEPVCVRRILRGCALKTDLRSKTIPPSGILPCEGRPPIRRAWTIVPDFELRWRGTSTLETSLWLATQRDHKFCAGARLRAQRFV